MANQKRGVRERQPGQGEHADAMPDGRRQLKVRLKTAKQRSASSQRWLERQLNDPYVAAAKREGYRSRSAYKLIEIDDKHRLLQARQARRRPRRGARRLEPGGGRARVRSVEGKGQVVAIDLLEMEAIAGVEFLRLDFMDATAPGRLAGHAARRPRRRRAVRHGRAGHRPHPHRPSAHHGRWPRRRPSSPARCWRPGGAFLCKVFQGGTERELLDRLKRAFASVRHVKPPASRAESAELYVIATGFRGAEPTAP